MAKSNTVAIVILGCLIFVLLKLILPTLFVLLKKWKRIWCTLLGCLIPLGILMLLSITIRYSRLDELSALGKTAGLRLLYANMAFKRYPINLFGHVVRTYGTSYFALNPNSTQEYFVIDCAYVYLLVRDGILASLYVWGITIYAFLQTMKCGKLFRAYIIGLMFVYSIMETGLLNYAFLFIFFAGVCVSETSRNAESSSCK